MKGPRIFKSELRPVLSEMKRNKTAGPDEIVKKILSASDDFRIDKVTKLINEIHNNGEIEDLSYAIIAVLPEETRCK